MSAAPAHGADVGKAIVFFVIALSLCVGVTMLAPVLGDRTPIVAMLTPLLSVSMMLLVVTRDGYTPEAWRSLGLDCAGFRVWGVALSVPLLVLAFPTGPSG